MHERVAECFDRELGGGLRRLLGGGGSRRPEVLAAICPALAAVRDEDRLGRLVKHPEPAVRSAAESALASMPPEDAGE